LVIIIILILPLLFYLAKGREAVAGMVIKVTVSPSIKANYYFINLTPTPVQYFYVALENSGSVECDALARIEFYNSSNISVYRIWSEKRYLWPGGNADLFFYSALPPGNYSAFVKILYCKDLYTYGPYNFEVKNYTPPKEGFIKVVKNETFEEYVELTLKSNVTLENVAVIPIEYPISWVFNSGFIEKIEAGKETKVKLFYEPVIWRERKIKVKAMTMDGEYATENEIWLIRKKEGFFDKLFKLLYSIFTWIKWK
jgi:hypothetical protein